MEMNDFNGTTILTYSISGALGGLALFLYSFRKGHYKNNQYIQKFSVEILGSAILASFLSDTVFLVILKSKPTIILVPFMVGVGWTSVMQAIRKSITKTVRRILKQ